MRVKSNGIELEVEVIGEGEPLVLIMGIGCQLVYWPDGLIDAFLDRGFQVIRFDNRDMGLSTWHDDLGVPSVLPMLATYALGLPVLGAPYTLSDMAADTAGLIEALGLGSAHVFGVSMGGMIAQTMAIETPHRLRTMTSVMSTTGDPWYVPSPKALKNLMAPAPRTREAAQERLMLLLDAFSGPLHPVDRVAARELAGRAWDRIGGHNGKGFLRQFAAVLASGSRRRALRSVRVPSLVIHGASDPLIPVAGGKAVAQAIPGAQFESIRGHGHTMPATVWPIFADLVQRHAGLLDAQPATEPGQARRAG